MHQTMFIAIAGALLAAEQPDNDLVPKLEIPRLTVTELMHAFQDNDALWDLTYENHEVEVTGAVTEVKRLRQAVASGSRQRASNPQYRVVLRCNSGCITALIDSQDRQRLAALPGDTATIRGTVYTSGGQICLGKCGVVAPDNRDAKPTMPPAARRWLEDQLRTLSVQFWEAVLCLPATLGLNFINVYSDGPNRHMHELINNSEDLRMIEEEWEPILFPEQPPQRTHGNNR